MKEKTPLIWQRLRSFLRKRDLDVSLFLFTVCMVFFGFFLERIGTGFIIYAFTDAACRVGDWLTGRKEWDAWYGEQGEAEDID